MSDRYTNRELSWLDFNERVLAIAEDPTTPLLERTKFLAIYSSNLDEFFQVRVAGLKEQQAAGVRTVSPDGLSATDQLEMIRRRVLGLSERQSRCFHESVAPALEEAGIAFSSYDSLDDDDRKYLDEQFRERVFPVVTPLAVDPAHPFPYISNLSLNLAVFVRNPRTGVTRFARVKVPPILPRFVVMPDGERFVSLEQVIAAHLDALFPGMEIVAHHPFRVTRNADFEIEEEEAHDLLAAIESELTRQTVRPGGSARGRARDPRPCARVADARDVGRARGRLPDARSARHGRAVLPQRACHDQTSIGRLSTG